MLHGQQSDKFFSIPTLRYLTPGGPTVTLIANERFNVVCMKNKKEKKLSQGLGVCGINFLVIP